MLYFIWDDASEKISSAFIMTEQHKKELLEQLQHNELFNQLINLDAFSVIEHLYKEYKETAFIYLLNAITKLSRYDAFSFMCNRFVYKTAIII